MREGVKQHLTKSGTIEDMIRSILALLLNFIKTRNKIKIHCDIEGYINPLAIIGDENRPDMIVTQNK